MSRIRILSLLWIHCICAGSVFRGAFVPSSSSRNPASSKFIPANPAMASSKAKTATTPVGATSEKKNLMDEDLTVHQHRILIHWRGEKDSGYSKPFRHLEFTSALEAELGISPEPIRKEGDPIVGVEFENALHYTGEAEMADVNIEHFNEAMQYVSVSLSPVTRSESESRLEDAILRAVERCSLVHAIYKIVASSETMDDLAELAIADGGFSDLYQGGPNQDQTWCFRARNYKDPHTSDVGREKRYGSRARSMALEKAGLKALTDLLIKFGGKVNLLEPDCKIYIFDGLLGKGKILARRMASGPKTSSIAPATRICITNTPLCPIASYSLCNVARITNESRILDPYAGSCATLLAASSIAPGCETVGIEIAHNGLVNREDIRKDFATRGLSLPRGLLLGDSSKETIRKEARACIGGGAFDAIVADPPYGIRESTAYNEQTPLEELFASIAKDRERGSPLLQKGGRLVAFVPVTDEESLCEMLPGKELTEEAGLSFEVCREQPLNEKLSRWLVSFVCHT